MINYNKLWKLLIDRNLKKGDLQNLADISAATIAKMGKNQIVSMDVIIKICLVLDCKIEDICEVRKG